MKKIILISNHKGLHYISKDKNPLPSEIIRWLIERTGSTQWFDASYVNKNRDNPILVECIETLGEYGRYENLVVATYNSHGGKYDYKLECNDLDNEIVKLTYKPKEIERIVVSGNVDAMFDYLDTLFT